MWRRLSIRYKMLAVVLVVLACMGSGLVAAIMVGAERERQREAVYTAHELSAAVDRSLRLAMLSGDREVVRGAAAALTEQGGVVGVAVFDAEGRRAVSAGSLLQAGSAVDELVAQARSVSAEASAEVGEATYAIVSPVMSEVACRSCHGERTGLGFISAIVSTAVEQRRIRAMRNRLLWGGLLLLTVTCLAIRQAVSRWIERPIMKLAGIVDSMRGSSVATDDTASRGDELVRLTTSFEAMMNEIDDKTRALLEGERELAQSQRIASIGLLAAGMAHEIAAPLSAVQLRADFLAKSGEGAVREAALAIKRAAQRIAGHQRDLLSFDRKDALDFSECDLVGLIRSCCELPEYPQVDLKLELPEGPLPATVVGDLFARAVRNILINAAQAMNGKGTLVVALRRSDRDQAEITIHDSGPGIAAKDLPHVFEPFFTRKSRTRGSGLGLAVAREIVVRHGGEISAETTPEGASLRVLVPLSPEGNTNGAHSDR
jgi:signal transduction histidine kinase